MEFILSDPGVVSNSVGVRTKEGSYLVDNATEDTPHWVQWHEVPNIASAQPNQSAFATYIDDSGYTHILFGDSASGRIPPVGSTVEVSYRYGIGSAANDLNENTLTTIIDNTLPVAQMTVSNTYQPLGGSDPETAASMRKSIPKGSQIKDRAVTLDDFTALSLQVPGVAKAVAYGQIYSAVNVKIAPVGGNLSNTDLMSQLREQVQAYLSDKILIGSDVFIEDAQWTDVYINMDLFVLNGFSQEQTKSDVVEVLTNLLAFDNLDMGEGITEGAVYRAAMRVEGVDYVQLIGLNTISAASTVARNIDVPFGFIARVAPTVGDDLGITVNAQGGVV